MARSTEMFSYTAPGALKAASPLGGPLGGNAVGRSWTFDARLNRATQLLVTQPDTLTYATGVSDRLTQVQFGYGWPTQTLGYDVDGRVTSIVQPADSSGQASWQLQLSPAAAGAANGGLESVYRGVSVNGLAWSYYYDATNRRRLKVYPTGEQDEYFHDADSSLLVDVGVDVLGGATKRPTDEYVWLDGRPVLVVRGRMTLGYVREADSQVGCGRNGEAATCGAYFLVTDNLNKPAVILDGAGKVSAFVDFSAQGEVNAVPMSQFKTASPYAANSNVAIGGALSLTGLVQPPGLQHDVRINYGMVDTEGPVGAPVDAVQVKAYTSAGVFIANMGGTVGGAHRGHVTTPWMGVLDGGVTLNLRFTSNASNCPPTGPCSPATWPYSGVNAVNYEYRRREAGAAAFSTPLRFPGQYYDVETQKHENWNRLFDPSSGRYLSPEPLLQDPQYVRLEAKNGQTVSSYAYGGNNPIANTDPTGNFVLKGTCGNWTAAVAIAMRWAGCKGGGTGAFEPNNECQYQQAMNGGCNICKFIEDGIGPDAFIRSLPLGAGAGHTNVTGFYVQPSWHPEPNSISFDDGRCSDSPEKLARTMIREASHFCAMATNRMVPDGATSTPGTCAYFGEVCASNNGGPILP